MTMRSPCRAFIDPVDVRPTSVAARLVAVRADRPASRGARPPEVALFAVALFAVALFAVAFFAVALFAVALFAVALFAVALFAVALFAVALFAVALFAVALFAVAFLLVVFRAAGFAVVLRGRLGAVLVRWHDRLPSNPHPRLNLSRRPSTARRRTVGERDLGGRGGPVWIASLPGSGSPRKFRTPGPRGIAPGCWSNPCFE